MPAITEAHEQAFAQESGELFLAALPPRRQERRASEADGRAVPPKDFPRPPGPRPLPSARVA